MIIKTCENNIRKILTRKVKILNLSICDSRLFTKKETNLVNLAKDKRVTILKNNHGYGGMENCHTKKLKTLSNYILINIEIGSFKDHI